jgi:hypothetical protein
MREESAKKQKVPLQKFMNFNFPPLFKKTQENTPSSLKSKDIFKKEFIQGKAEHDIASYYEDFYKRLQENARIVSYENELPEILINNNPKHFWNTMMINIIQDYSKDHTIVSDEVSKKFDYEFEVFSLLNCFLGNPYRDVSFAI